MGSDGLGPSDPRPPLFRPGPQQRPTTGVSAQGRKLSTDRWGVRAVAKHSPVGDAGSCRHPQVVLLHFGAPVVTEVERPGSADRPVAGSAKAGSELGCHDAHASRHATRGEAPTPIVMCGSSGCPVRQSRGSTGGVSRNSGSRRKSAIGGTVRTPGAAPQRSCLKLPRLPPRSTPWRRPRRRLRSASR